MGYTHYWRRPEILDASLFRAFSRDCHDLALAWEEAIAYEDDEPDHAPEFATDRIHFNGVGDDGHETFYLSSVYDAYPGQKPWGDGRWFEFCKTAFKPYDALVCACLIAFRVRFGDTVQVTSDGDWDEWQDGRTLYARTFPDRPEPTAILDRS